MNELDFNMEASDLYDRLVQAFMDAESGDVKAQQYIEYLWGVYDPDVMKDAKMEALGSLGQ